MAPHFGPAVIGQEAFDQQVKQQARGGSVFGPLVRDPDATEAQPVARQAAANQHGASVAKTPVAAVSVAELRTLLTDNPSLFDTLYEIELARAEGPREEALQVFLQVELQQTTRAAIVGEIQALLAAFGIAATTPPPAPAAPPVTPPIVDPDE